MHSITDCSELLQRLNFMIKSINCRNNSIFYLKFIKTKYISYSPAAGNSNNNIDLFNTTLYDL